MNKTVVLARYNEDISWSNGYNRIVIQKGEHLPNKGREPSSYLRFIIDNYDKLNGQYFFLQGNPLDHQPSIKDFINNDYSENFIWVPTDGRASLKCDLMGRPHDTVDLQEFIDICGLQYTKDYAIFHGCCLFMATADCIRNRPLEFYQRMYDYLMSNEKAPYAFERLISTIFVECSQS